MGAWCMPCVWQRISLSRGLAFQINQHGKARSPSGSQRQDSLQMQVNFITRRLFIQGKAYKRKSQSTGDLAQPRSIPHSCQLGRGGLGQVENRCQPSSLPSATSLKGHMWLFLLPWTQCLCLLRIPLLHLKEMVYGNEAFEQSIGLDKAMNVEPWSDWISV